MTENQTEVIFGQESKESGSKIFVRDEDFEASVYDTDILGVPVVIAIGQPEDTFLKSDNIIY